MLEVKTRVGGDNPFSIQGITAIYKVFVSVFMLENNSDASHGRASKGSVATASVAPGHDHGCIARSTRGLQTPVVVFPQAILVVAKMVEVVP
jgi:hypothetical protein